MASLHSQKSSCDMRMGPVRRQEDKSNGKKNQEKLDFCRGSDVRVCFWTRASPHSTVPLLHGEKAHGPQAPSRRRQRGTCVTRRTGLGVSGEAAATPHPGLWCWLARGSSAFLVLPGCGALAEPTSPGLRPVSHPWPGARSRPAPINSSDNEIGIAP